MHAVTDPADDIAKARALVSAMCAGDHWRMCIPVQRDDSDILLSRVLEGYEHALTRLAEADRIIRGALAEADALAAGTAELEQLRADAARLDWLEEHGEEISWLRPSSDTPFVEFSYDQGAGSGMGYVEGYDLRTAIDAAMQGGETGGATT